MSSVIILKNDYAELKLSDSKLDKLREDLQEIAQEWKIDPQSTVMKFIEWFHGSTFLNIYNRLKTKENIELFGKLFLAAVKKAASEGYYDYAEAPFDPELRSYYYKMLYKCMNPVFQGSVLYEANLGEFTQETWRDIQKRYS